MGPLPWPSGAAYLDGAYMPIDEAVRFATGSK